LFVGCLFVFFSLGSVARKACLEVKQEAFPQVSRGQAALHMPFSHQD